MRENERGLRFGNIAHSDPNMSSNSVFPFDHDDFPTRCSSLVHASPNNDGYDPSRMSGEGSPMTMSPWNQTTPYNNSDHYRRSRRFDGENSPANSLIGSLVREEGHIYSLAAYGELLYTGSASKNIRVWKNLKEFSGFKPKSGLVKAIIISGQKIFTGHQDGKIRVWKINPKSPGVHKRAGTLPTLMDIFKSSVRPSNYVEIRGRRTGLWIKHSDAISCLSLSDDKTLLYSASWDRTVKVWRVEDYKCLESIRAHDDAVNAVVATAGGLVLSGSADGTVKVWRREVHGKAAKHVFVQKLLEQESAVTALAVDPSGSVVYCGSSDGLVSFWEREKQFSRGGVLKGHRLAVLCLAAAGNLAFSGSADKTVCVWRRDGMSHTRLTVLTGHAGPVKCLAVEPDVDGDRRWVVYTGSLDKSVKVWSVSEFSPDFDQTAVMQRPRRYSESSPPSSDDGSFSSEGRGGK